MGNPFKKDNFVEARINARISPEKLQQMMDAKTRIYTAKIIHTGVCGYREQNDITYLSADVLYRMADSYLGRPVVVGHDLNITNDNIEEKMKGTVVRCYTNDGEDWDVDFTVSDPKVVKKIEEEGYNYVSCAYIITEQAEEPEMHDGLECTTVVLNGFYHHLAITNSPRYDGTEIWRVNEGEENNDLKKFGFSGIVKIESKENSNKEKKTMFAFLKKEVPVDENLMFDTAAGRLNTSDLVAKVDELVKENAELKEQLNCSGKKADDKDDKDGKDEDKKDDKENKKNEKKDDSKDKDNCSGKKNEDDEEKDKKKKDDAKDDDKDSKENENHEPGTAIPEAQAKANEEAMKSDALKDAMPKVNENPGTVEVSVRGLSKLK